MAAVKSTVFRPATRASNAKAVGLTATAISFCLFFGLAIAYLPWWLASGLVLAPVVLLGGAAWPFPILVFGLALIFELVPGRFVPPLGSFHIQELIVLYLAFVVAMRALWTRESVLDPMGPFRWPLLYLLFCVLVSAVYAKLFAHNEFLLTELRGFVMWLVLPLLCFTVRSDHQRRLLIAFSIVTGSIVAMYSVAQSLLNIRLLASRVESLDITNADVTRSIAGGATYLMVFGLYWVINRGVARARLWWLTPVIGIIAGAGLAVSFGRGVWLATFVGFLIAAFANRGVRGMLISAVIGLVAVVLVIGTLAVVKPRLAEAVVDRAIGTSTEFESGGSFRWRLTEISYALNAIAKSPLTGVGIGGDYKQRVTAVGGFQNETRYIHNSYVGFMVKMGVQALLFQVAFAATFYVVAWRLRKRIAAVDRPTFGALVGAFSVPLITSFTQPEWFTNGGVSVLCLLAGLVILYRVAPGTVNGTQGPA